MLKIYCIVYNKYRKFKKTKVYCVNRSRCRNFKNPKILYIFEKTVVICDLYYL